MGFKTRPRFAEPEKERPFEIIGYEDNGFPISNIDTEKEYYHIENEDTYVAAERLQKYLAEKLLNNDPLADYIMDILKDEMTADGELKEITVADIMKGMV